MSRIFNFSTLCSSIGTIRKTAMENSTLRRNTMDGFLLKCEMLLSKSVSTKNITRRQLLSCSKQHHSTNEISKWRPNNAELLPEGVIFDISELSVEVSQIVESCDSVCQMSENDFMKQGLSTVFDNQLQFHMNGQDVLRALCQGLHTVGDITSGVCASKCEAYGLKATKGIVGKVGKPALEGV